MDRKQILRLALSAVVLVLLAACAPEVVQRNDQGNKAFAEEAYEQALDAYRLAQVAEPDRPEPYYNAANAHNRMGDVDGVKRQSEQALIGADPVTAAQTWYNLGNAYANSQSWTKAVEAYKEALRLAPDDADAKHNLELALQMLDAQQQAQSEPSPEASKDSEEQQSEQSQSQESDGETGEPAESAESAQGTPTSQASASESDETLATPTPMAAVQETEAAEMTEEQAEQLLRALLGESQTLAERLQRIHSTPAPPTAQDW